MACTEQDLGYYLPDDAIKLARYMVARYGAHQVIWMLGGDGNYRGEKAERWKRIGRAVFGSNSPWLVTMHPGGQQWVADEFRGESWFDFISYQSGHGDNSQHLRWLVEGYPAKQWRKYPPKPVINQEPNYEAHVPLDHPGTGESPPWHASLCSQGAVSVTHVKAFLDSVQWWRLRPGQELLKEQPGTDDPAKFIAIAKAEDNSFAVAYLPTGGAISLHSGGWQPSTCCWYNPRTGEWLDEMEFAQCLVAPDGEDWVLWMG